MAQDCHLAQDGRWVAVTVNPRDRAALAELTGGVERLAGWIGARGGAEAVAALEARRIAAALVLDGVGVADERGTGWTQAIRPLPSGELVKGFLFDDAADPMEVTTEAVLLGTHTREVLRRVGQFTDDEIDTLASAGAIALAPSPAEAAAP